MGLVEMNLRLVPVKVQTLRAERSRFRSRLVWGMGRQGDGRAGEWAGREDGWAERMGGQR